MKKVSKISLIGSGNIGGTLAHIAANKCLGNIVLLDRTLGTAQGKALDIAQSTSITKNGCYLKGTDNYADIVDSDAIIITAGVPRKPGMSRDDLLNINADIIKNVSEQIKQHSPNSFVVVITNPLDAMVCALQKYSGINTNKVVGMAGVLDSARFCYFLSQELNIAVEDIQTMVLGGHGDNMVPLPKYTSIAGIPLMQMLKNGLISANKLEEIIKRTRNGGGEIVELLKTGSAFYSPATSAIAMVESYLFNRKRVLPCAAHLNGEYGVSGLYVGVPAIIGNTGVEKIIEVELDAEEKRMFEKSVSGVRELVNILKL